MLENEQNLIAKAATGDSEAFGVLYDEYHPQIYRFVFLKVSSKEDAEDLTHQVFMNALEHMPGYRHQGFPFSSWLYRIARNAVIDHYRTRKEKVSLEDADPEVFAVSEDIQVDTNRVLEFEKVRKAIAKLSDLHQDVIIMRFVEELAIREVAVALKKSEGAVKLLQHRAIAELQRIIYELEGPTQ
jgi:RNA polymerase sigma-70 factor (ECF subfamily)